MTRSPRRRRAKASKARVIDFNDWQQARELTQKPGILLGQTGRDGRAPLLAWPLQGSALTIAPTKSGATALIALNLLMPGGRGFPGSTVIVDPDGEIWCITAARRRALGRRALLVDPWGVVAGYGAGVPAAQLAAGGRVVSFNPLDFIRDDQVLAVEDIDVVVDALLCPPVQDAADTTQYLHNCAKIVLAGYIAWVRFREPRQSRTLHRLYSLLLLHGDAREAFFEEVLASPSFANGLAVRAVQLLTLLDLVGSLSPLVMLISRLCFMRFSTLQEAMASSSFDMGGIDDGSTDLFIVLPSDLLSSAQPWLRLWLAMLSALACRRRFESEVLMIVDNAAQLGLMEPLLELYGGDRPPGLHVWSVVRSFEELRAAWGKRAQQRLIDGAEVLQFLDASHEAPRDAIGAPSPTQENPRQQRLLLRAPGRLCEDHMLYRADYWYRPDTRNLAEPNPLRWPQFSSERQ